MYSTKGDGQKMIWKINCMKGKCQWEKQSQQSTKGTCLSKLFTKSNINREIRIISSQSQRWHDHLNNDDKIKLAT